MRYDAYLAPSPPDPGGPEGLGRREQVFASIEPVRGDREVEVRDDRGRVATARVDLRFEAGGYGRTCEMFVLTPDGARRVDSLGDLPGRLDRPPDREGLDGPRHPEGACVLRPA
jgi:hypothetical protein